MWKPHPNPSMTNEGRITSIKTIKILKPILPLYHIELQCTYDALYPCNTGYLLKFLLLKMDYGYFTFNPSGAKHVWWQQEDHDMMKY